MDGGILNDRQGIQILKPVQTDKEKSMIPQLLMGAGLATQIGSNIWSAQEQEKARNEEINRQRALARKAAIQRAIGADFGPANFREPKEVNLTGPAILGGLGQLGTALGAGGFGENFGGPPVMYNKPAYKPDLLRNFNY